MINYKDKPLEALTLEETIEFEKEMRKKSLAAAKNGYDAEQIAFENQLREEARREKRKAEAFVYRTRARVLRAPPNA